MSKPEGIPQDVWDKADSLMHHIPADFSCGGFENAKANRIFASEEVARLIMAAKAEEREACARVLEVRAFEERAIKESTALGCIGQTSRG